MAKIEIITAVQASRQKIWDFVSDPKQYPEWIHFVREVFGITDFPLKKGAVYYERAKPGPVETVSKWIVTEFDPPKRQVHIGEETAMSYRLTIELERLGENMTQWRHTLEFRALPRFRPLGVVIEKLLHRKMHKELERVVGAGKDIIEQ